MESLMIALRCTQVEHIGGGVLFGTPIRETLSESFAAWSQHKPRTSLEFLRRAPYSLRLIEFHTISLKNAAIPCTIRVYRGWNRVICCHFVAETTRSLVNQGFIRWYGWFLNRYTGQSGRSEKFFIFFLRFTEQIPPFFDIIYRGVILLPSRVKVEP